MQLSVVVVSWNTRELLDRCLSTLKDDLQGLEYEVFVVDNASHDGSADMVAAKHSWARLIANDTNRGFAAANNQAFALASGDHILLLNPDTEVMPGAVGALLEFFQSHPHAGIVAPQLINSDGSIQRSCRQFPSFVNMGYELLGLGRLFPNEPRFRAYKMLDFDHKSQCQVDQPEGACLLVRKEVLDEVGEFDEGYFMLFEEVDWCYRIKAAGWQIWFTPAARIVHHYGQSIKQVKLKMIWSSHRGLYRFWRKHYRGDAWFFDAPVYLGLMGFAFLRMAAQYVKGKNATQPGRIESSQTEDSVKELVANKK
jgi:N-acetylglucosaminyl-diphospho-decaprenol L-rhamnosyltransferase